MSYVAPQQPRVRSRVGAALLVAAASVVAFVGVSAHLPLAVLPLLLAGGGLAVPRGSTARSVLFTLASIGVAMVLALFVLAAAVLVLLVGAGGGHFG